MKFSGYPGTPRRCPFLYEQVPNFKLKKSKSISLNFVYFFKASWGPLGLPKKTEHQQIFQGTQVPSNIALFCTNKYLTLSLKS